MQIYFWKFYKTQICKREDNGDTNNDNNYDTNNENRYVNVDNEYQPDSHDAGFVPDYDNDYEEAKSEEKEQDQDLFTEKDQLEGVNIWRREM